MRKLVILLAVAALATSSTGCCGRIRNWFHKGSPCGTMMSPAVLGAPVAMSGPIMSAPMPAMSSVPCCVPCDPCADPCAMGVSTGYFGGYMSGGSADCGCSGGESTFVPSSQPISSGVYPGPQQ